MEKSFSLVPVSVSKQVVETDYLTEEAQKVMTADAEKRALSQYEELTQEVERLEFEKEMTEIRAENTRKYYENEFAELLDEIEQLVIEVEDKYSDVDDEYDLEDDEKDFSDDDDDTDRHKKHKRGSADMDIEDYLREAIESPQDRDGVSDINEDDDGFNYTDNTAASLKKKCRKIYLAICSKTHPDRCGNTSKVHLFRQAVSAFESLNLKALETIYEKVFGKPFGKTNLMERLIALRMRKAILENEIQLIRRSNSWALHLLELEEGRASARQQYEAALRNKISELRSILRGDFFKCES